MENIFPSIVTPEELAKTLKVSRVYIYKLVREKRIPFFHVDRVVRFSGSEVQAWLEEKRNQPWIRDRNKSRKNRPPDGESSVKK
jgi:excisionase family DNA binding protein